MIADLNCGKSKGDSPTENRLTDSIVSPSKLVQDSRGQPQLVLNVTVGIQLRLPSACAIECVEKSVTGSGLRVRRVVRRASKRHGGVFSSARQTHLIQGIQIGFRPLAIEAASALGQLLQTPDPPFIAYPSCE